MLALGILAVGMGMVTAVLVTFRVKKTEDDLFHEKELAQVTLRSIGDAVITTDMHDQIDYMNPVAEQLTGWALNEARGLPLGDVFLTIDEISREPLEPITCRTLLDGPVNDINSRSLLIRRDNREFAVEISAAPICDRSNQAIGSVLTFRDVTKARTLAQQLTWQAKHDSLTGLMNRREFELHLKHAIENVRIHGGKNALLYIDLDQFKVVNDTCGHQAGDRLLKQLTSVVQTRIRTTDTLARLGGDEFGVLLADCTLDTASRIAENLRQAIRDFRFIWQDRVMSVGVSIGLAEINGAAETLAAVMSAADVACYSAKDSGRNRVQTYKQSRAPERHREMQWVSRINRACDEDRLELLCQTIVPIRSDVEKLRHFELLLRMRDEHG
jgi:diguanylate cyclase (GGDEF)-like protein/PAS domain S-box-containing protein